MDRQDKNKYQDEILNNLSDIHQRIAVACNRCGRSQDEVRLMLVTKTVPVNTIRKVLDHGERLIGENLIGELEEKVDDLRTDQTPEIHFIGPLMENELDRIIHHVDCIQTVDHYSEAYLLNDKLQKLDQKMDILIQVNTSRRDSPYGISPAHTIGLVLQIARLKNLRIKGLMTLGLFNANVENARNCFQLLRNLFDELVLLAIPGVRMEILSMGMSDHLETAIEEGSNMVRVGSAIFGERDTPDSYYWKD